MKTTEKFETLKDGKEKAILKVSNGFNVELFNDPNKKEGASMRCWWDNDKENGMDITSLEQLTQAFNSRN